MKKITLLIIFGAVFCQVRGQIDPVDNLIWNQWYIHSYNQFEMHWDVPNTSTDTLVGFNIYQGDVFYRFQTDSTLYHIVPMAPTYPPPYSNCPESFIFAAPFWAHVTAVYNSDHIESSYNDSVYVTEILIGINEIKLSKHAPYPNPTNGNLTIDHDHLNNILVFDLTGKMVKKLKPMPQIDLSDLPTGVYLIKLVGKEKTSVKKIILK